MVLLHQFLNHVLPAEGTKCWVAIRKTGSKSEIQQGFVNTIDELIAALRHIDGRKWNAFMACATFDPAKLADVQRRHDAGERQPNGKPLKMRSHENALCAKSFWLDIDAGPKKPYATADAAIEALDNFCAATRLPLPTVVESGNGVHAWWTLDQVVPAATWERAAAALKSLTVTHGLHADPARTSDISSILRGTETTNWKDVANPKPVTCEELMPVVPAAAFMTALASVAPAMPSAPVPAASAGLAASLTNVSRPPSEPSSAAKAVEHCKQLAHFRATKGNIEEPLWYANLGVLAHCADGEALAHEWSSGHPQYTAAETGNKLLQARSMAGPTTCKKFEDLNPAGCQGCPHRVSSPILLGRGEAITVPEVKTQGDERPALPWGFKWGRNMELMTNPPAPKDPAKADEGEQPVIVSQYAIYLSGLRTSENRSDGRGMVFQQWFPHEGWVQFEIGAEELAGNGGRQALAKHGVLIAQHHWIKFMTYCHRASLMLRGVSGDDTRFDQFGWKHDRKEFVLGQIVYRIDGTKRLAAGSKEVDQRGKMMVPAPQGSLAGWTEFADRLFQPGCEGQGFSLLASFAAPLMTYVSGDEGGALLALYSAKSGTGKTTTLDGVASVWGELDAIRLTKGDTQVAKFRSLATLCNLPVVFDEMANKDPMVTHEFVSSFTVGRDKKRGRRDGSIDITADKWQTILISAANESIIDKLGIGGSDPQAARIFELEIKLPPGLKSTSTKELSDGLKANKGYAGAAYIQLLMNAATQKWIKDTLPILMLHYEKTLGAGSEHRFIIRLLACCAIAAHIVVKAGILHFDIDRIISWALDQAAMRVRDYVSFDALAAFKHIINDNSQDCLVVGDRFHPRHQTVVKKQPTRALRMRYEMKPQRMYIPADVVRKWLTDANKPYGSVMRDMMAEGIVLNAKAMRSLGAGTDYVTAQVPCWEIDMAHPAMSGEARLVEVISAAAAHEK